MVLLRNKNHRFENPPSMKGIFRYYDEADPARGQRRGKKPQKRRGTFGFPLSSLWKDLHSIFHPRIFLSGLAFFFFLSGARRQAEQALCRFGRLDRRQSLCDSFPDDGPPSPLLQVSEDGEGNQGFDGDRLTKAVILNDPEMDELVCS